MHTTTLTITGMSCGSCRNHVDAALRAVAGVTQVHVDLAAGSVRISHEDGVMPADLILAVEDAGYDAHLPGPTP
ncbi:MAG: heavy-metal-associated domain-containing protein [Planctomycetes bacterium]|nr:heavy-metal-associated domain-containing protein [Planctomycetota bacterium]